MGFRLGWVLLGFGAGMGSAVEEMDLLCQCKVNLAWFLVVQLKVVCFISMGTVICNWVLNLQFDCL